MAGKAFEIVLKVDQTNLHNIEELRDFLVCARVGDCDVWTCVYNSGGGECYVRQVGINEDGRCVALTLRDDKEKASTQTVEEAGDAYDAAITDFIDAVEREDEE